MNATAKWLVCGASLGFALSASWANAGTHPFATGLAVSLAAPLATGEAEVEASKISAAREAMKAGRLDEAEQLINDAARMGIKHDALMARFQDTPEKARQDLQKLRAKQGGPVAPSSKFSAWPPATTKPVAAMGVERTDPFAARASDSTIDRMTNDSKSKAARYLENGRNCLKQGDMAGAISWHTKARAENATFGAGEYTPDALASELRQAGVEPSRLPASSAGAPRFGNQEMPLDDRDLAAQIPAYAPRADMRSAFQGAVVSSPDDVQPERNPLTRSAPQPQMIRNENVQQTGYEPEAAAPRRLPTPGAEAAPSPQKQQAMQLMAHARIAMSKGDVNAANQLAQQAQDLRVPEREFGQDETRPWQLLMETSRAVSRRGGAQAVQPAGFAESANYNEQNGFNVQRGVYDPNADRSRNMAAQATEAPVEPGPLPGGPRVPEVWDGDPNTAGPQYYDAGMKAFIAGDRDLALQYFKQALKYREQLDQGARSQLKDKMLALEAPRPQRLPMGE
ncbi:MAG TPA: hypothetical protein VL096_12270, partial [Pirellulaceae bacterium]|nr:hypothetical protein [Pirellulaceae bacterium]